MLNFIFFARSSNFLVTLSHLNNAFLYLSFYMKNNFRTIDKSRHSRSIVSTWAHSPICVFNTRYLNREGTQINKEIQVLEKATHWSQVHLLKRTCQKTSWVLRITACKIHTNDMDIFGKRLMDQLVLNLEIVINKWKSHECFVWKTITF